MLFPLADEAVGISGRRAIRCYFGSEEPVAFSARTPSRCHFTSQTNPLPFRVAEEAVGISALTNPSQVAHQFPLPDPSGSPVPLPTQVAHQFPSSPKWLTSSPPHPSGSPVPLTAPKWLTSSSHPDVFKTCIFELASSRLTNIRVVNQRRVYF